MKTKWLETLSMIGKGRRTALAAAVVSMLLLVMSGIAGATTCPGRTSTIDGIGSSLQKVAQEQVWIPGYTGTCREVAVTYEPRGSGEGLRAWSAERGTAGAAAASGKEFIATDDAPTATQLTNMERANERQPVTMVPVAQAAIAVFMNLPAGCRIRQLSNRRLEEVWRGAVTTWETIEANCRGPITRVVRLDVSGTTFQFKHYLWLINRGRFAAGGRETEWLELQTEPLNTTWPGTVEPARANGGGAVVEEVNARRGSIGYAAWSDALSRKGAEVLALSIENGGGVRFISPEDGARNSNCAATVYRRELGTGGEIGEGELRTNWLEVYGSNPRTEERVATERNYPICTLTWIGVTLHYNRAGFPVGTGALIKSYVQYVVNANLGQRALEGRNYSKLPASIQRGSERTAERIEE